MAGKTLLTRWWVPTTAIAFAVGWALAPTGDPAGQTDSAAHPPPRKTKSSQQRTMLDRSNPSANFVWNLLEEMDAANSPDSVAPAPDRAAAGRAAIDAWVSDGRDKQLLTEAKIRFAHWLESDPKAAVLYWNGSGYRQSVEELAGVARKYLLTIDPGKLVDWLVENRELCSGVASETLVAVLANACSGGRNLELLERASAEMSPNMARYLLIQTIASWPANDLKSIEECVRKNPDSNIVRKLISRMQPEQVVPWLRNEIATNGDLAETLKADGMIASTLVSAHGVSINERIALLEEMESSGDSRKRSGILPSTLVQIDVRDWLSRTDAEPGVLTDWRQRLRLGEITASDVMEGARSALPSLAKEQSEELRDRIFGELAAINATSAMELISNLPLQQRERAMMKAAITVAGQGDPQHMLELASTMPPTLSTPANERFQMWSRAAAPSYAKYGESYVSWVTDMAPGIERDWALSGISMHFRTSDPEKSAQLAALKTLPAGWRPDQ